MRSLLSQYLAPFFAVAIFSYWVLYHNLLPITNVTGGLSYESGFLPLFPQNQSISSSGSFEIAGIDNGRDGALESVLNHVHSGKWADGAADLNYSCFPPRPLLSGDVTLQNNHTSTVVYLELQWGDLHGETFYSFVHQLCSCSIDKPPIWTLKMDSVPQFYFGPEKFLSSGFKSLLEIFNETTCGPIFFGTPIDPQLTVVTTTYSKSIRREHTKKLNDTSYILICHEEAPEYESAENVYFLTPHHRHFIPPTFFPPKMVRQSIVDEKQRQHRPPTFLVLGGFLHGSKRNVKSLKNVFAVHRDKNFTLRLMGSTPKKHSDGVMGNILAGFLGGYHTLKKVEVVRDPDAFSFMMNVSEVDAILPVVDETNFYNVTGYQGGKKLTSAVMWALGFHKKLVMFEPLADVFGIRPDNSSFWLYQDEDEFATAFGRCLESILDSRKD